MRKILVIMLLSILIVASCKKNTITTNAGTWTFRSTTYHGTSGSYIQGALTAYTGDNTPTGSIAFYFSDTAPRLASYTVTSNNIVPPAPGQVFIVLTDTAATQSYWPTASTIANVTVTTTAGKVTVTLPPVMMKNINNIPFFDPQVGAPTGTDSALVSGTIIQTQ